MTKVLFLTTIVIILMSACLRAMAAQGMHPNFKSFALMIPVIYLFAWAKTTLATNP